MDDVDAVQAQIARNMLDSGDWVTARLDGVAYLEKSPLIYWLMAVSFASSACMTGPRASLSLRRSALLADGALRRAGRLDESRLLCGLAWQPASGCFCLPGS